jgi:hypothetical protein
MARNYLLEAVSYVAYQADKFNYTIGKTKLYKILFMADWEHFCSDKKTITGRKWLRIPMGPALGSPEWREIEKGASQFGFKVEADPSRFKPELSEYQLVFLQERPTTMSSLARECLDRFLRLLGPLRSQEAAAHSYETPPMRWIVARERVLMEDWNGREIPMADPERDRFMFLAKAYAERTLTVAELSAKTGYEPWTVAALLDVLEVGRSPVRLQEHERELILKQMLALASSGSISMPSEAEIWDEVAHSQRIEGIYFSPDYFITRTDKRR